MYDVPHIGLVDPLRKGTKGLSASRQIEETNRGSYHAEGDCALKVTYQPVAFRRSRGTLETHS